jgi:hypothetical protein
MVSSIGKVGAAGDNAAMESFFALLQKKSWTARPGESETTGASQSSPGSNGPTTDATDKQHSDD